MFTDDEPLSEHGGWFFSLTCDLVGENGIEHFALFLLFVHGHVSETKLSRGVQRKSRLGVGGFNSARCLIVTYSTRTRAEAPKSRHFRLGNNLRPPSTRKLGKPVDVKRADIERVGLNAP